ncbi:hypothetical protein JOC86_000238 [Bacillus pakistanensis]|uniref:Aminoglycoside phosphotransferase domain-containing protein n=1 Tax=Rossellomorea pakistanensis TaxID=992288 RepID=A0ABS2N768_9BACI|nr:hypothetical protein [Bacillus pakistanensis]MBM7583701.1 hypothetical protein [Bacillus pakistanensis]
MDLQFLFNEPIVTIQELNPGYEDHASDVWLVETESQEVIVRSSRMRDEPNNDFWWGCRRLFGIDPRKVYNLEKVNNQLNGISSIPIPRIIGKGKKGREFVVVEKLNGQIVQSFTNQQSSVLQSLGKGLAEIHNQKKNYIGNPSACLQIKKEDFHHHFITGIQDIVDRYYRNHSSILLKLDEMIDRIITLPPLDYTSYVLVDMDPTQFLSNGEVITGLVDTEGYAVAPRELDFIALEYVLDEKSAAEFQKGYEKVLDLPDLTKCRLPYRYLYRLLSVQGDVNIEEWLEHKYLF